MSAATRPLDITRVVRTWTWILLGAAAIVGAIDITLYAAVEHAKALQARRR